MLVQFVPTGDVKDTTLVTPNKGYAGGPYALPVIGAAAGTTNTYYGGKITSGSALGLAPASAGRSFLLWKTASNATVASWQMDNEAAIATAIATIGTALAAGENLLYLNSDGSAGS